jgi:hypothetical protein
VAHEEHETVGTRCFGASPCPRNEACKVFESWLSSTNDTDWTLKI